ncbi:MAG: ATP-dependent sacrificial sulfur transferase LarE [Chloroflexi bacterium]|nr:ATP-dependent sacrificial sulfur transferase LarE [Chloroflexota bacterium]
MTEPDGVRNLAAKEALLHGILRELGRVAVALSGGVDSSYLLAAAVSALGPERVLALTAESPFFPGDEAELSRRIAASLGVEHRMLPVDDLANPQVASNPVDRCYHCKRARFELLRDLAAESDGAMLVHGENADDHLQYRPGSAAAREVGARAPLAEAGLGKAEIRTLARRAGLPNWDRPAAACLATRFPYDTPLTREGLARVEGAERFLHDLLGTSALRVRDHYPIARLELAPEDIPRAAQDPLRRQISEGLTARGYRYVTLDLDGYRSGSFDDRVANQS